MARACTPATRAAAGLIPIDWMNRPSAVCLTTRCSASHTPSAMKSAKGSPSRKPLPMKKYGA